MFSNPVSLTLKDQQMVITFKDNKDMVTRPIEDIGFLRAAVSRALIGSGLYPAFGVFHRSRYNAFPLADDVMEPYRPFVDEIVYHLYYDGATTELTNQSKRQLLRLLFADVKIGKVTRPLENALSLTTASLLKIYKGETDKLSLPMIT